MERQRNTLGAIKSGCLDNGALTAPTRRGDSAAATACAHMPTAPKLQSERRPFRSDLWPTWQIEDSR